MPGIIEGYEYDIFISYRQKDNKYDGWITEFADNLKRELDSVFKEEVSVYFDINPSDYLLETHDVDASLKTKLKCLVFIPIISRTYCDPRSFAWEHEFKAFISLASRDRFGLTVRLPGGNVANRVLPVRIHDLEKTDIKECESVLGGFLRGVEFIYKSPGVNRPLRSKEDNPGDNQNKTFYRDQINKVALAIRDIIVSMKSPVSPADVTDKDTQADIEERLGKSKIAEAKKHNLPVSTSTFVGREKEMKKVIDLLRKSRLVTITGAGGCGKTRLAREIALTLIEEYKDGVWFVDLAPVTDPGLITRSIIAVLGISEEPTRPIIDTLIDNIRDRSLLLLLDNCEHLTEACAEISDKILQSVNGIRILATSREALNIPGESVWRIPSLSVPEPGSQVIPEEIQHFEAVKLFTDRAASGKPDFVIDSRNVSTIISICRRVAGIPLAIELAASRIRHLGAETILERLEDQFNILSTSSKAVPERQQTLKATIDWSYNLLSEVEQLMFNRLSVFAGNFSLEAVEEICADEKLDNKIIVTILSQLVDKSLIIAETREDGSSRYSWLVPMQQYSLQKLIESGGEEIYRKSHLAYYLKMAEQAYEEQFDSELKWLNKLENEHPDIIAALNWSYTHFIEGYILLSGYMAWFWNLRSYYKLALDNLEKALAIAPGKSEAYARVSAGLGRIYVFVKTEDRSRRTNLLNESLGIWRQFNNIREEAIVMSEIGYPYFHDGDFETAQEYIGQSLELARKVGSLGLINYCLTNLCQIFVHSKKYDLGLPLVEELLVTSEKLEHPYGIYCSRHYHADCAQGMKDFREAEKRYGLALETAVKYGYVLMAVTDVQGVAFAISGQLRWAKSIRLEAAAEEKYKDLGITLKGMIKFWDEWIETYIDGARKEVGEKMALEYEKEGKKMGFEAAIQYALDFEKD